jgi:hypothetical protein
MHYRTSVTKAIAGSVELTRTKLLKVSQESDRRDALHGLLDDPFQGTEAESLLDDSSGIWRHMILCINLSLL